MFFYQSLKNQNKTKKHHSFKIPTQCLWILGSTPHINASYINGLKTTTTKKWTENHEIKILIRKGRKRVKEKREITSKSERSSSTEEGGSASSLPASRSWSSSSLSSGAIDVNLGAIGSWSFRSSTESLHSTRFQKIEALKALQLKPIYGFPMRQMN